MSTIYVSSTFEDLRAERTSVRDALSALGHRPVMMEDYGADERLPLDKCVEDVSRCDAVVHIVGWRRGYEPAQTPGVSIVQSEYQAAVERKIPVLVYLVPESERGCSYPADEDLDPIQGYRDLLCARKTVAFFRSSEDLRARVTADVAQRIGVERPIPPTLPYLCDRTLQVHLVRQAYAKAPADRPVVCLIQGNHEQALSGFVDSLRDVHLPGLLGRTDAPLTELTPQWLLDAPPDGEIAHLQSSLAQELGVDADALESLPLSLRDLDGGVLVSTHLPTDRWNRTEHNALCSIVQYWLEDFRLPSRIRVFVLLILTEPRGPTWMPSCYLRRRAVRQSLHDISSRHAQAPAFLLLPSLRSVPRSDVEQWMRQQEVRRFLPDQLDPVSALNQLFEQRSEVPMGTLAPRLHDLLRAGERPAASS